MAKKKKLTTVTLSCKLKGSGKWENVKLTVAHAEALLNSPKAKNSWKLNDENYKLEDGRIIAN